MAIQGSCLLTSPPQVIVSTCTAAGMLSAGAWGLQALGPSAGFDVVLMDEAGQVSAHHLAVLTDLGSQHVWLSQAASGQDLANMACRNTALHHHFLLKINLPCLQPVRRPCCLRR
jgi:hypothetical protein